MNILVAVDVHHVDDHPAMPTSRKTTAEIDVLIAVTPKYSLGVQKNCISKGLTSPI